MKKIVYTLIFTALTVAQSFAQTDAPVVVGGTQKGDTHATMEILSQQGTKGFMPPRLTTTQVTTLGSGLTTASNGLTVFNTDTNCLQYWKGDKWSDCSTYSNAELTVDCTGSTIKGIYNVDKIAGDNEFMELKVTVTKGGPFVFYSDNQNGVRFYLSTILDIGAHTIEVPALGTPKAAGDFTYNLFDQSANPICVGNTNFKTTVVENKAAFTINCDQSSFVGTILEGSAANGQTMKLKIEVSKSGNYYIKTNTVQGLWFEGSGLINLGTTEIILDLKGSANAVSGDGKVAFNFFDKNNASLAQCAVSIYVSAEKARYTVDCNSFAFSGGVGLATGSSAVKNSRLFYVGYVYGENDYIKVKVNVTRPGFIDLSTDEPDDKVSMRYAYSGYVEKIGIQDVYLRPINSQVPAIPASYGDQWPGSYSSLFSDINNSDFKTQVCNMSGMVFSVDTKLAEIALLKYDPALNSAGEALISQIKLFLPGSVPAAGIDLKINVGLWNFGLFSFKGTANGMTLESNEGIYNNWNLETVNFKLTGTLTQGDVVVFPMYNTITGVSAGSITIKFVHYTN